MLSEDEKKAIERLKERINNSEDYKTVQVWLTDDIVAVDTVLNLITKLQKENEEKDKQIDLMAEYINEIDLSEDICEGRTMCDEDCEKCIKQYFAGLVEKE